MRKSILSIFLVLIFIFNSGFLVVGHRGDPTKYPEQTTQSFDSAFNSGADYVELDIHVSKDNQLVVSHDKNLARVTGTNAIVSQNFFSYLNSLKQGNGEPIYSLAQLFQHYQNQPNVKFLVETKKTKKNNPKNMEELLVQLIKQYNMQDRVIVHSFSYKSLKVMQQLMPEIPRIFIVGSLKRINFDVLQYIDGINISSKLVTPKLIEQLHYMKKQVFVWDQMNEDPKQWNWLVNLPIDGVVTNFPATGYQYKIAKIGSKTFKVNKPARLISTTPIKVQENPYQPVETGEQVLPYQEVKIQNGVIVNKQKYYQIGNAKYVPASAFNYNTDSNNYLPYLGQTVIFNSEKNPTTYSSPASPLEAVGKLNPGQKYEILAMNKNGTATWIKTSVGWIQNKHVLINNLDLSNLSDFKTKIYYSLPLKQRLTNINLSLNPIQSKISHNPGFIDNLINSSSLLLKKNDRM